MNNDPVNNIPTPESNPKKRCPRCGKELPADATFCGECGLNLLAGGASQPYTVPAPSGMPPADTAPLKTSDYVVMLLLAAIPLVGLILMIVWAFASDGNLNRRNFCRAQLIMMIISTVLSLIVLIIYGVIIASVFSSPEIASGFEYYYGMIFR